jgi:hypothetical protein
MHDESKGREHPTMTVTSPPRKTRWVGAMGNVLVALGDSRRALRRAARTAGDPRMAHRLGRLARRRRAAARNLTRAMASSNTGAAQGETAAPPILTELHAAGEIGTTAELLRSNRRLRAAIEVALEARPPAPLERRLEGLREQTDRDAGILNMRLRELVLAPIPPGASGAPLHEDRGVARIG